MRLKLSMLACTALTAAALVTPALAKGDTVTMTREQYEAIMNRLDRLEKGAATPGGDATLEQRVQDLEISQGARINALQQRADAVQLSFDNARPVITTGDGRFEMAFRGRFHFDAGTYSQSPGNDVPYAVDGQNVRDLNSGSYFRRAQFGVEGKFFRDFDYEMRFNFGGSEIEDAGSINIMRVAYNPTPEIRINIGAIQPTFTLDDSTSSNDITFLERAAVVNALIGEFGGSDSRKGIEATYLKQGETSDWMINVAYTTSTIGARNANADDRDHLLGRIAARVYKDFGLGRSPRRQRRDCPVDGRCGCDLADGRLGRPEPQLPRSPGTPHQRRPSGRHGQHPGRKRLDVGP
ncbi:MAG: porin [Micropepsaceae bacterium]